MGIEETLRGRAITYYGYDLDDDWTAVAYRESQNDDALSDAWLESDTSYIWRVGVLVLYDNNKCDWCRILIGTQRSEASVAKVIGMLEWEGGENDDPARTVKRAMEMASIVHPVFHAD